jgi:hypothetical protein
VKAGCDDDADGPSSGFQSNVAFRGVAGATYYFRVGGYFGRDGTAHLHVRTALPPANDGPAGALVVPATLPYAMSQSTRNATLGSGEPHPGCIVDPGQTVWYRHTPSVTGVVTVSDTWSHFARFLAVYTGSPASGFVLKACEPLSTTFTAVAGTTYWIQFGGITGSSGDMLIDIHAGP